jgi:hypothetical protein
MKWKYLSMILVAGLISLACTTRVSEWVLLNAVPNNYTLVYIHGDPISASVKKQNQALIEGLGNANIRFESVKRSGITRPYYALYYRNRLFARYEAIDEMNGLVNSALREEIAGELMAGKLCVMLYLKTDHREKDNTGFKTLQRALASSPFGSIIKVVELSRNSKDEAHFASMLLQVEDDLKYIQEPMLFGIFGRFKALEPLLGKGISEENIHMMIDYFTAECSCLIKDDLPGTDILFPDKWKNPKTALLNQIIDDNPSLGY